MGAKYIGGGLKAPGATLAYASCSTKLSPVRFYDAGRKRAAVESIGPRVTSTHVSISSTCPETCSFRDNGCYAQHGMTRRVVAPLDAAKVTGKAAMIAETVLIRSAFRGGRVPQDGKRGGRDLRLHVAGDVASQAGAELLAGAAADWRARGGGAVWTYTHRWREIPAESWGQIAVWASCETPAEVREAHRHSYRASLVVPESLGSKRVGVSGVEVIPCPWETRGRTCAECRLCLDAPLDPRHVIGFVAHGQGVERAKRRLTVLRAS